MRLYNYTDKFLLALGIANLWMFVPTILSIWQEYSFVFAGQGDRSQILGIVLISTIKWLVILIFTTWAFFKRWHWVVALYVLYLSVLVPATITMLLQYWKENNNLNFLYSAIYGYTYIFLWLLGMVTLIIILIETDYNGLINRWRSYSVPRK